MFCIKICLYTTRRDSVPFLMQCNPECMHACPERPVTQRKCPRTNKNIPIFVTVVETREGVSQLFPLSAFRENTFFLFRLSSHAIALRKKEQAACRDTDSGIN